MGAKEIQASLKKLHEKIKSGEEVSEEDVRVASVKSGILEELGYAGELKDIRFEKAVKGKRSDLLAFDNYKNVVFVIEFKNPGESLDEHLAQLWDRYVKPLKAKYGLLTNGLELLIFERIDSNWDRRLKVNLSQITSPQCEEIYYWLKKPKIERTRVDEVLKYFERFDKPDERINLSSEIAQKHFFDNFELKEGSVFVDLLQQTIGLFDSELERSKFLRSAYDFWKTAYAKKPEKIPENWRKIIEKIGLEANEENLFKFMFCLESAYSLFTRLILAKACEDYKLPYVDFSEFIKLEIKRISHRGDITLLAWAIISKHLIDSMREKLVKSVFEGDLFYWWEDSFKELKHGDALYSPKQEKQKGYFGEAVAEIILTLYKFDFSEIIGDPLGTLYQRYFDKETRKALGEFYTPKEVVDYIIDAVGYEGRSVLDKRLLDPACGSGTFLVDALKRYLKAAYDAGEEMNVALRRLCNEYHIVGFDIHPFATFMAQMQFMLILIPAYKKAIEEDPKFVLNRLPIFRTDSLVDETRGEAQKVTLMTYANGTRKIEVDTSLPTRKGDGTENLKIEMPYDKDAISDKTGLLNIPEYFAALQAVFDTVKESAWKEKYEVDKEKLSRNLKHYLPEKDWNKLISFFAPYAEHFLVKFEELKETFGDGRLIKSIEDIILAAILKNYVKYDFVVGNPPYVRKELISTKYEEKILAPLYPEVYHGDNDLYVYFMGRGLKWLNEQGKFSFITSNKFIKTRYGKPLRKYVLNNASIEQLIDFGDTKVFADAINYPIIFVFSKNGEENLKINTVVVNLEKSSDVELLEHIKSNINQELYFDRHISVFKVKQGKLSEDVWKLAPEEFYGITEKISRESKSVKEISNVYYGIKTGLNEVLIVDEEKANSLNLGNLVRPILGGEDIKKYSIIDRKKYLIFPYVKADQKYKVVKLDDYPNLKNYLTEHRDALAARYDIKASGVDWYELRPCDYYEIFDSPKIITPDISDKNNFSYDDGKYYLLNTAFVITLNDEYDDKIKFVLGLLNSKLLEFYFKQVSTHVRGGYYRYITQYLEQLPIKLPSNSKEQKLADEITKKVEKILEKAKLEQKIEKFPDEYIREYRSKGVEFDSIEMTFDSDHKAIEPIIEESIDGGFNILIGKKEKSIFIDTKAKANYVAATLKGKSANRGEKKQILVPRNNAISEEILEKLEANRANTKTPSIKELEEEINERIYKLYGLDANDTRVIEEFLKRF